MKRCVFLAACSLFVADAALAQRFSPPGVLSPSRSGRGVRDGRVWAPGIRFPIRDTPAFANSQVYGYGGGSPPGPGGQCDARNFSFPWHDNYCESRGHRMPLCPAGRGHQGQDIRAATCRGGVHPAVAVVDGTVTNVGSFSVYITASDGTRYDYLHMSGVRVRNGQRVRCGDVLGMVDDTFFSRGRPVPTTVHLHFNIRQNVRGIGPAFVPVYTSLIEAYERLERGEACTGSSTPPMDAGPAPAPGARGCVSPTLGRTVSHLDCVQVDRGACGASSCGTYQCMDGEWGCPGSGTCGTLHQQSASCGMPAPTPPPEPTPGVCRSATLGRNVNSGECVQTDGRRRSGEPAACANGCGVYRCDDGRWRCESDRSACSQTFDNAACGSGGAACRSDTLGRQVSSGSCVQVSRPACGESTCGWYRCGDGSWTCTDVSSCDGERFGNAVCGDGDPCAEASECGTCAEITGCGWCESAGECQSSSSASACADWVDDRNECVACNASDCESCAVSGFCSWCPGIGCVNDSDPAELAMCSEIIRTADRCE